MIKRRENAKREKERGKERVKGEEKK